jgi:hypothetical protein
MDTDSRRFGHGLTGFSGAEIGSQISQMDTDGRGFGHGLTGFSGAEIGS